MHTKMRELVEAQKCCLKNLVLSIPDLRKVYDESKLAQVIVELNGKLEKGQLDENKLITIQGVVLSPLYDNPDCRRVHIFLRNQEIKP